MKKSRGRLTRTICCSVGCKPVATSQLWKLLGCQECFADRCAGTPGAATFTFRDPLDGTLDPRHSSTGRLDIPVLSHNETVVSCRIDGQSTDSPSYSIAGKSVSTVFRKILYNFLKLQVDHCSLLVKKILYSMCSRTALM